MSVASEAKPCRWPRGMQEATAAEYVGLSVSSLRTVVKTGAVKPIKLTPGRQVFLREDLDAYLDRAAGRDKVAVENEWLAAFK